MSEHLKTFNASEFKYKAVLIAAIAGALVFAWFAVRWQVGNMLAEFTQPSSQNAGEVAKAAVSFAPSDPLSLWLAATTRERESLSNSVTTLEDVVRMSPKDYRWWIELGRRYERAERPEDAERALVHSVKLAPEYTFPRWQLGNFYLRQGRTDDAFAHLKIVTGKSSVYRWQVFSLAWEYFGGDVSRVDAAVASTSEALAALSQFYAMKGLGPDSLRVWNEIPAEGKAKLTGSARAITRILLDKQVFPQALEFTLQAGAEPNARFETITNPGFESSIAPKEETFFGWQLDREIAKVDIATDSSVKHGGTRSLKVNFRSPTSAAFYNATQAVAVIPSQRYRLSFWVRTENLQSGGPPLLQILNARGGTELAASSPFSTGSNDWRQVTVDFVTPDECSGVYIRTTRAFCGEVCPITGTFWYDDFELTRQ